MKTFAPLKSSLRILVALAPLALIACGGAEGSSSASADQALTNSTTFELAIKPTLKDNSFEGSDVVIDKPEVGPIVHMKLGDRVRVTNNTAKAYDVIANNEAQIKTIQPGQTATFKPERGNSLDSLRGMPTVWPGSLDEDVSTILEVLDPSTPLPDHPCCDLPGGG